MLKLVRLVGVLAMAVPPLAACYVAPGPVVVRPRPVYVAPPPPPPPRPRPPVILVP